jgi:PAS domain S-box-containing protein
MVEKKILVADDEPLNLMLYTEMLKPSGYSITTVNDGAEAVEKANHLLPDLIILDWNMPRLDGLEALKQIKSNPIFNDTPVIMITGIMTAPENLKLALEAGAIDFLRKPFDKIEFHARVKSTLLLAQSKKELNERYKIIERNNKFINALMESIPHPMVYYAIDGVVKGCNHRFLGLFGFKENQAIGERVYTFCGDEMKQFHQTKDRELLNSRTYLVYEDKVGKEGNDYIFSKSLFYNDQDEPEGILCIMTDISELKKAHNMIVESKTRELTSSALRLIQIGEMNNNLILDLEKVFPHLDNAGSEQMRNIINRFSLNAGGNIWQEFETRFENVYESFYKRLNQKYPDLTKGERKLCALLRLNLSSKDIAALMFQNPQSIDMARYRLRKKLNLNQDENLIDFLLKIDE